jgi:DNA-3-methyladenine glycosylase II
MTHRSTGHPQKRLTRARLLEGVEALAAADPQLGGVVSRFGPPPLWTRKPGYAALVQIVLEQQVSLAYGRSTFARLREACGEVTAERVAGLPAPALRAAGVSRQKASYCLGIARHIVDRSLDLKALGRADDGAVRERLMRIRGIGPWTANIYLMTALGRPDVWPDGDLALAVAAQQVKNLRERPDTRRLREMAERWAPWRTVAARILWHHYLST